jgi:hypothetical protein
MLRLLGRMVTRRSEERGLIMDATETPRTDAVWRNKSFGFYEMRDIANTLERELAAMTAERDALVQTCGELCPRCGWRGLRGDPEQCAFCQNAKLSADLYNMTARAELAERQVAVLCKRIAELMYQNECPTGEDCEKYKDCSGCWAAWSRAEAEKGGKG